MAKMKYSLKEALLGLSRLTPAQNENLEPIKNARNRVLATPGGVADCKSVRDEAGCKMADVVTILPLLEAIERGHEQDNSPHDPGAVAPLPDPLADAIKGMHSGLNVFGNTVAGLMRECLTQERERTRSAFEPRTITAENALKDMTFQKNSAEDTTSAVAGDFVELRSEHDEAKRYLEKLEGDVTAIQIECSRANERATQLAEEARLLREAKLDELEIHRHAIERIRKEHAAALKFEQDRLAALIDAFIRKEKASDI